jgi:hypothetical protein
MVPTHALPIGAPGARAASRAGSREVVQVGVRLDQLTLVTLWLRR